jgi:1-acylglycerone phosphate reductase
MVQKTVLITGCSAGGIGEALAKEFHKKGLRVFATARNLAKMEELKALGLDIIQLDVVDEESIEQAVETVRVATGGALDFLVNNSGGGINSRVVLRTLTDGLRLQSAVIRHQCC